MSYPSGIGAPECTILYSGPEEVFNRVKPILMALGGNTLFVGTAIGHASALDLSALTFVLGAMLGFVQGYIVSETEGLSPGSIHGIYQIDPSHRRGSCRDFCENSTEGLFRK